MLIVNAFLRVFLRGEALIKILTLNLDILRLSFKSIICENGSSTLLFLLLIDLHRRLHLVLFTLVRTIH